MIKIDLVTGFLGSGKTTFIKKYASFFLRQGQRVGILENDFGAVNVDVMLLNGLESDNCRLETVAGACDADCHRRRFKTKLIALGMGGLDRVIIEPSGIFDIDEFFDALYEEPLDKWYEPGSVITIVDPLSLDNLSPQSQYLLASQTASAGSIVISKVNHAAPEKISLAAERINQLWETFKCHRRIKTDDLIVRDWELLSDSELTVIANSGCRHERFIKTLSENHGYTSFYYMNSDLSVEEIKNIVPLIFKNCKGVFRIKGFVFENNIWYQINADPRNIEICSIPQGQRIIIVIGENIEKSYIDKYFTKE